MIKLIVIFVFGTVGAISRGPHHPRGEKVVKHHVHYTPSRHSSPKKMTQDEELLHDTTHLEEHSEDLVDVSTMSEEELDFFYFQVHDSDKNSKLDGLEMLQAIHHTAHNFEYTKGETIDKDEDFQYYIELIDRVLTEDDADRDGFLSYPEYIAGRRKDVEVPQISDIEPL
ncbi:hypothetical protein PPYR_08053 [Photinus pyralis]|uniref:EF-hand domain-containing protein n=2 Tax=Photinus pyralis TaxID=7054 RepID=A0A5N4ASB7_PHOPY|nr:multiple coagulation factor deficiency protein 2 [Photinus pyralis]KAB0800173.1 hypothetical protein PPYR_08053 [Photinus pyralis]